MPCMDGGPSREQEFEERAMPAVLCAVLTRIELEDDLPKFLAACDWTEAGVTVEWVRLWWESHKAHDARRRTRERDAASPRGNRETVRRGTRRAGVAAMTPSPWDAGGA
jgi:hypothetical protein